MRWSRSTLDSPRQAGLVAGAMLGLWCSIASAGPPAGDRTAEAEEAPTFTRDVAPLLQKHCQECHRPAKIGPFSLVTYDEARRRAFDLATITADRRMPPWPASPDFGPGFQHDRSLTEEEIAVFQDWADAGAPEGDPDDLPTAPEFADGWALGEPDVIIEMTEPFEVPASGEDIYRCFVIPNPLDEDAEIIGLEYRPGNPSVVHHILGYIDASGKARELDSAEDGPGYTCYGGPRIDIRGDLGGWAPGANASFLPEGVGRILPKGADIVMQVHYHASGKPETDVSRLGLHLAPKDKPITRALHWWAAGPDPEQLAHRNEHGGFLIPAGESHYRIDATTLPLPCEVDILAVSPHMHMVGKDMEMFALLPGDDGREPRRIDLIRIDHWDFNWQLQYLLEEPIRLPKGSVIRAVAHYDNTLDNPNYPLETLQDIVEGEATFEEMCFGFFAAVKVDQDLTRGDEDDLHILFRKQLRDSGEESRKRAAALGGDE